MVVPFRYAILSLVRNVFEGGALQKLIDEAKNKKGEIDRETDNMSISDLMCWINFAERYNNQISVAEKRLAELLEKPGMPSDSFAKPQRKGGKIIKKATTQTVLEFCGGRVVLEDAQEAKGIDRYEDHGRLRSNLCNFKTKPGTSLPPPVGLVDRLIRGSFKVLLPKDHKFIEDLYLFHGRIRDLLYLIDPVQTSKTQIKIFTDGLRETTQKFFLKTRPLFPDVQLEPLLSMHMNTIQAILKDESNSRNNDNLRFPSPLESIGNRKATTPYSDHSYQSAPLGSPTGEFQDSTEFQQSLLDLRLRAPKPSKTNLIWGYLSDLQGRLNELEEALIGIALDTADTVTALDIFDEVDFDLGQLLGSLGLDAVVEEGIVELMGGHFETLKALTGRFHKRK
jgi:hypothetical protein